MTIGITINKMENHLSPLLLWVHIHKHSHVHNTKGSPTAELHNRRVMNSRAFSNSMHFQMIQSISHAHTHTHMHTVIEWLGTMHTVTVSNINLEKQANRLEYAYCVAVASRCSQCVCVECVQWGTLKNQIYNNNIQTHGHWHNGLIHALPHWIAKQ